MTSNEIRASFLTFFEKNGHRIVPSSPLAPGAGVVELPRFFAERYAPPEKKNLENQVRGSLSALNATGYWPAPLPQTSHPYKGVPAKANVPGDFASTYVGDETDTSPFTDAAQTTSISTAEYLRNMNVLVEWLAQGNR